MSTHPFKSFINNYVEISEADWKRVEEQLTKQTYQKNELILREGQICKDLFFLQTGLLRYFTMREGEEVTKFFTDAPYAFTSQKSFTDRKPALESIQAIEECVVWKLSIENAEMLLTIPSWSEFVRKLIQEVQFYTENILLEIQTKTAEVRYKELLERNPQLVNRIPIKYLASYFGIAAQSLSRIRKQMVENR